MSRITRRGRTRCRYIDDRQTEHGQRVTPLELFFDLVVVFAITQVTSFLSDNPTWGGLMRGLLLPVALEVPALIALSLVTIICASLIAYEAIRHREARAWIRSRRGAIHDRRSFHGLPCRNDPPEGPPFSTRRPMTLGAAHQRRTPARRVWVVTETATAAHAPPFRESARATAYLPGTRHDHQRAPPRLAQANGGARGP